MEYQNPQTQSQTPQNASSSSEHTTLSLRSKFLHQVRTNLLFKSKWAELNGAMGDLGTYIPIVLALTLSRDLNLGTTLIFTGVYNIITGAIYGVPMPVQPMKSIAAVALSNPDFGVPEIMAAGILTGGILFALGVTGLMRLVYRLIPLSVVRGIQLAQGLSFALTAVRYVRNVQDLPKSKSTGIRPWLGLDGLVLAIVCAGFIVVVNGAGEEHNSIENPDNNNRDEDQEPERERPISRFDRLKEKIALFPIPSAFLVFVLGVVLAFARRPKLVHDIAFGPSPMEVVRISRRAWRDGFVKGAIPQLPLSILNSVIAVCKLSSDLFPERDFTATSLSVTVGLMNVVGCWFGAMPCCHGAGGLAGQYKFGGRSGACVAILGACKTALGLVVGTSLAAVLSSFPVGVLGVLLLFAGIELAMTSRDMRSKEDSFVMLVCTAVSLVGSSAALGFVCGMVVYGLLRVRKLGSEKPCSAMWMHGSGTP
ncbi:Molybdate transporter [Trema orientale]|uniref:Molybdate transporter n=1 Tax=Trema orientale TaxID=63057 RepID=A0A2P5G165_TREOI|nr:Molybdate transporter [Trema orientale]